MPYLDHAASTALRPEAHEAFERALAAGPANPTGAHGRAQALRAYLEKAREQIAALCDVRPNDVVFTSGGTESDNWVIRTGSDHGCVLYSAVEHPAVAEPAVRAGGLEIPVDGAGVVDLEALAILLRANAPVGVVSVMAANNETGVIQPLDQIAQIVSELAPDALFHTDAVQAFAKLALGIGTRGPHAVSLSAHKIGGLIGTGALVCHESRTLEPLLLGGGQERGLRAGTPDPPGALAFAAAADAAAADDWSRIGRLRDRFEAALRAAIDDIEVHGARARRLPTHCLVGIRGIASEMAVIMCDQAGLEISAGSSCASGAAKPSGVLAAMGASGEGVLRFSLGWSTTDADIDAALEIVCDVVGRLRIPSGAS